MSGCVPSRLALLVRLSTWTLILGLRTCEFVDSDTLKHTLKLITLHSWVFTPESSQYPGSLGNRSIFDTNSSSTVRHQDGRTWTITYGMLSEPF